MQQNNVRAFLNIYVQSSAFASLDDPEASARVVAPLDGDDAHAAEKVDQGQHSHDSAQPELDKGRNGQRMVGNQRHKQKANYGLKEWCEFLSSHCVEHQAEGDVREDVVDEEHNEGALVSVGGESGHGHVANYAKDGRAKHNQGCFDVLAHCLTKAIIHE